MNTRPLWEEIFDEDSKAFLDYYYERKTKNNWIQTDEEAGQLISMIHWNPYPLQLGDELVESRYLVAVATRKAWRHQGRMAALLTQGLQRFAGENMPLVWLMPADPDIYRPFGFRYIYSKAEGIWPQIGCRSASAQGSAGSGTQPSAVAGDPGSGTQPPVIAEGPGSDTRPNVIAGELGAGNPLLARVLAASEYPAAADFMNRQLSLRFRTFVKRSVSYLTDLEAECQTEGGHLMGIFHGTQLAGVFSYWMGQGPEIRELVTGVDYENGEKKRWLIASVREALSAGDANCQVLADTPEVLKPEEAHITAITTGWLGERKPIIMGRIANAEAFLKCCRATVPTTRIFRVEDPLVPENNGAFLWQGGPQESVVRRLNENRLAKSISADRIWNISELMCLFFHDTISANEALVSFAPVFLNEIV